MNTSSYYVVEVIACTESSPSLSLACHVAGGLGIHLERIGHFQREAGDFVVMVLWETAATLKEAEEKEASIAKVRALDPVRILGELSPPEVILGILETWEPIAHSAARTLQ
ncbi:hypothetical protein [Pseudomonas paraeruginosa]|uniref:hypothetical protein n=1 Tax=Pseudomonas paraeruginosa TaxID=2994495 RepID=UPI00053E5FBD|nr:hypothetical protein [Pseudomonas paraeruginosa]